MGWVLSAYVVFHYMDDWRKANFRRNKNYADEHIYGPWLSKPDSRFYGVSVLIVINTNGIWDLNIFIFEANAYDYGACNMVIKQRSRMVVKSFVDYRIRGCSDGLNYDIDTSKK